MPRMRAEPARGEDQPHEHLEGGGFARAVRSEKAENLSFFHGQVQRAQSVLGLLAPEADGVGFF